MQDWEVGVIAAVDTHGEMKVVRPVAIREVIRFRTHGGASHISLIKTRDIAEILAERRPIAPSPEFLPQAPSGTR